MSVKDTKAEVNTITYDRDKIEEKVGSIYEAIVIMGKRAEQINAEIRSELHQKLDEFAVHNSTLEEVFELANAYGNTKVMFNIETKSYPDPASAGYKNNADPKKFVEVFYNILKKYDMEDRVVLQSFDWQTLIEMKKLNPNISTSALWQVQPSWGRDSESLRRYEKKKSPWLGGLDIKDYQGNPVKAAHAIGADIISPYYT